MQKILIVDDDKEMCDLLKEFLGEEGFAVDCRHSGDEGLEAILQGNADLVILDGMLPVLNGFEILRRARQQTQIPVVMLTARGEEVDRVVGLELGADDYLPKPFSPRELVARIKAIFRRTATERASPTVAGESLTVGDLEMNVMGRVLTRSGERLHLTEVEFHILEILLRAAGSLVKRQDLAMQALGRHLTFDDRSLDVHISNIRRKLGSRMGEVERIRTIRGEGYIYAALAE